MKKKKRRPWGSNRAAVAAMPLNPHIAANEPSPTEHLLQICDRVLAIAEHVDAAMFPSDGKHKTRSSKTSA